MTKRINIPKERLIELYVKQKLSTHKIGKVIGCDPTVVQNRLREQGIKLKNPKKKIIISKKRLNHLYINKKLSIQKISKLLKISSCSVYYKLKEANIKTRKKRIFDINKKKLEELYIEKKLSCSKIARLYNFDTVTIFNRLKKYSIKTRNYFEANIKYPKRIFDGDDELKAYMIGFRLGDLNVRSLKDKSTVIVKSSTTKEDQVNLIKSVYGIYGHFWVKKYGEVFSTMTFLDNSFNFLVKKEDNIEDWIMQKDRLFLAFLAGYTDAEGSIGISQKRARFRIRTYDKDILFQIHRHLSRLGVNSNFGLIRKRGFYGMKRQNKDCFGVSVNSKESLLRLLKYLKPYIKHKKRYEDLIMAERNILERNKNQGVAIGI